jgi:hypothetical protein
MIDQNHPALIRPKVGTEAHAGPAERAQVSLDDLFFQIQRTFDLRAHHFLPFLLLTPDWLACWLFGIEGTSGKTRKDGFDSSLKYIRNFVKPECS